MKLTPYILMVFLALVFASCHKKTESKISIQMHNLSNYASGSHYANVRYNIVETRIGFGIGKKAKLIVADNLDANGHAELTLKMKADYSYSLAFVTPDNICYNDIPFEHLLDQNETNNVDFSYAPCGYLKFILNNANCNGTDDSITYSRPWVSNNEFEGSNTYIGCDYFEGDYFELSSGEYRYDWEVFKNGVSNSFSQNFVLNEGDSVIFQIDY